MLNSMTGFGFARGQLDCVEYDVEVRSVNNRYFKAAIRLPECWSSAEADVEKLVRSKVARGTVTLSVRMRVADEHAAMRVNAAALSCYVEQLKVVDVEGNPTLRVDLGSLLQLPGVCEPPELEELLQRTRDGLMGLITQALDGLLEMRRAEGEGIGTDLIGRCDDIEKALDRVGELAPRVVQDYHDRLAARVQELLHTGAVEIDEAALAREVAVFAERCDIAEEMSRLRSHVRQFRQEMDSPGAVGRKLDFIAQEMLREANTIASKANDADIARAVVEIKTGIDRIKEQVQNVE